MRLREWFENLSISEKSIVLTVVDKDLVTLVVEMYKVYKANGNGKFTNSRYPADKRSLNDFIKVR